jgi:Transposase IS4
MAPNRSTYSPATPFVITLTNRDGTSFAYEPTEIPVERRHEPEFALPDGVELSVENLSHVFVPDWLVAEMAQHSNAYAARRRLPPEMVQEPITDDEIFRFLAVYYYMGVVRLPARRDYWKCDHFSPFHNLPQLFERRRFDYIWRNLCLSADGHDAEDEGDLDSDDDDDLVGHDSDNKTDDDYHEYDDVDGGIIRRDQRDRGPDSEAEEADEAAPGPAHWHVGVETIIDHVNKASQLVCNHPGFACSISEQTVRMKGSPIQEGHKVFALCDASTGFVYNFEPNGRLAAGSIHDNVVSLAGSLPRRNQLKYVVAMNSFFTRPRAIASLREMGVAVVGTARAKRGWPPPEIKAIDDARFNTLYLLHDTMNFLIARWVGNRAKTMVSTIHTGTEIQIRQRLRPRATTSANRNQIRSVWGNQSVRDIAIPGVVDDYNQWMLGAVRTDELIECYRPNLRCRRGWMPLFFQCLDIIRVNAYIASQSAHSHKRFIEQWSEQLCERALLFKFERTAPARRIALAMKPASPQKRRRTTKNSELPPARLQGAPEDHIVTIVKRQRTCLYCAHVAMQAKVEGRPPTHVRKVTRICVACQVPLCKDHFDVYHSEEQPRRASPSA